MFLHFAIHRPFHDKAEPLIDSMTRFAQSMEGKPGLQQVFVLRDQKSGALVGLALWDSKADWEAARPAMLEAVKDDPFEDWEPETPDIFHLDILYRSENA